MSACEMVTDGLILRRPSPVRPEHEPSLRSLERLGMTHVEDISDRYGASRLYVLRRE